MQSKPAPRLSQQGAYLIATVPGATRERDSNCVYLYCPRDMKMSDSLGGMQHSTAVTAWWAVAGLCMPLPTVITIQNIWKPTQCGYGVHNWPQGLGGGGGGGASAAACSGCCNKIAEAEAAVSVNEEKWLVMHVHVQLRLDELRGPPNSWLTVT